MVAGSLLGLYARVSTRLLGLVMAFGAGVLISAVSFELTLEAFESGGSGSVIGGLCAGAATFFIGDWLIDQRGGHRRKSPINQTHVSAGGATALVLGALLDGIPESAAIGSSLLGGGERLLELLDTQVEVRDAENARAIEPIHGGRDPAGRGLYREIGDLCEQ